MCGRRPNLELAFLRRLFNDENRGRRRILFRFGLHSQLDHQGGLGHMLHREGDETFSELRLEVPQRLADDRLLCTRRDDDVPKVHLSSIVDVQRRYSLEISNSGACHTRDP